MDRKEALQLLNKAGLPKNVIAHVKKVAEVSLDIGKKLQVKGKDIDLNFLECGALLHDIGRAVTNDKYHGIEGAKILSDYPQYARVCEVHIFAGISAEEAEKLGLPKRDYLPKRIEEEIIAYADNLVEEDKLTDGKSKIKRIGHWLGDNHPIVKRMKDLDKKMNSLLAS